MCRNANAEAKKATCFRVFHKEDFIDGKRAVSMMSWNKVAVRELLPPLSVNKTERKAIKHDFASLPKCTSEVVSAQSKADRMSVGTRSEIDMISPMRIRSFVVVKVVSRNRRAFLTSTEASSAATAATDDVVL